MNLSKPLSLVADLHPLQNDKLWSVLEIVIRILMQRFPGVKFEADTPNDGLIDSQAIIEVILEVEEVAGVRFDMGNFDINGPLTPMKFALAFRA